MIRILVADDHAVVRRGLRQIVADTDDITVADEAQSAHEVLDSIFRDNFDVIVLDISMPGTDGLDLLKQIKTRKPNQPVLILTMHPENQYAVRSIKAGAAGFLTKESVPDELVAAIRKVYRGGKYVSPSLGEIFALELSAETEKPPHESLSDREFQVMVMIAKGRKPKDIADRLFLSPKTVSTYRSRILEKMKMRSNEELTLYAIKNHLIS